MPPGQDGTQSPCSEPPCATSHVGTREQRLAQSWRPAALEGFLDLKPGQCREGVVRGTWAKTGKVLLAEGAA